MMTGPENNDFPELDIARKYRAKAINYGIFVDIEENIDFLNVGEIALLGKSKGKILSFGHDIYKSYCSIMILKFK